MLSVSCINLDSLTRFYEKEPLDRITLQIQTKIRDFAANWRTQGATARTPASTHEIDRIFWHVHLSRTDELLKQPAVAKRFGELAGSWADALSFALGSKGLSLELEILFKGCAGRAGTRAASFAEISSQAEKNQDLLRNASVGVDLCDNCNGC